MAKLIYIGTSDPFEPTEGTDVVSRIHLEQLSRAEFLEAVLVHHNHVPNQTLAQKNFNSSFIFHTFSSDMNGEISAIKRNLIKIKNLLSFGLMQSINFKSLKAHKKIMSLLDGEPSIIVIDHIHSLINLGIKGLFKVIRNQHKIVFISIDFTANVLRDSAKTSPSLLRKFLRNVSAIHALIIEGIIYKFSAKFVFISSYDKCLFEQIFGADPIKNEVALPLISQLKSGTLENSSASSCASPPLVFIGSPSHFPNKIALDWIAFQLVPALRRRSSNITLILVGKGTEIYSNDDLGIVGLGFVGDFELSSLIQGALGMLCPVTLGSGLKIKILDAISENCMIFANSFSLRGYEIFGISPLIDVEDPEASAQLIISFANDINQITDEKKRMQYAYVKVYKEMDGKLFRIIRNI